MSTGPLTAIAHDGDATDDDEIGARQDFVYDVDGVTRHHDRPKITGAQIMIAAGIPSTDGLVQLLADGTTATVRPEDEVHLAPDAQFKRRPRFKRG